MEAINMQLEQMVSEVKRFDENKIIVEFNNGYAVAFEKRSHADFEAQIIPEEYEWKHTGLLSPLDSNFSEEMQKKIAEYPRKCLERVHKVESTVRELYTQMIEPLKIKKCKYMDVLKGLHLPPALFGYLTIPLIPVYALLRLPEELISPSGRAYRILNKKLLTTKQNGRDPAIYSDDNYYHHEPFMNPNRIFEKKSIGLDFPPTTEYKFFVSLDGETTSKITSPITYALGDQPDLFLRSQSWYERSKYYLKVDEDLKSEVYRQAQAQIDEKENWKNFKEKLNKENQTSLLKNIGFI